MSVANVKRDLSADEYIDKILMVARRGILLAPDDAYIYDSLGNGYYAAASYAGFKDQDATEYLESAIKYFEMAISKQPNFPVSLTNLGLVLVLKAELLLSKPAFDPMVSLRAAAGYLNRACAADPLYAPAWNDLIITHVVAISILVNRGQDPSGQIDEMNKSLEKALMAGIKIGLIFYNSIRGHQYYIDYLALKGDEAAMTRAWEQALALAIKAEKNLITSDTLRPDVSLFRAVAEGHVLLSRGQDPSAVLAEGLSQVQKCLPDKPFQAGCERWAGSLSLIAESFARRRGESVLPHLAQAAAHARRAVGHYDLGEHRVRLVRALVRLAGAQPPRTWPSLIAEALQHIADGLKVEPGIGELHALRAQLHLLQGKTAATARQHHDFAQKARDELAQTVKLNPLLARAYKHILTEAESP